MSSRSLRRSRRKIGVAALAAATLGLAGLGLVASPAQALPDFAFERLAGADRIETAVDISSNTFTESDTALIARADLYPDALAGNYLAGAETAPILLSHTGEVPAETLAELERLGVTSVTLLGGTEALDASVQTTLEGEGYTVDREAGTDRYETAAAIAQTQDATTIGEVDGARTAILATGENFPDALTGGPLAYAGNHPILLTPSDSLGDDAQGALEALGIEHVLILGGTAAVDASVEAELTAMTITSERLAGDTRFDTATDIAEFALTQGFTDAHINVATGMKFPDALTGGPHAGEEVTPILLANEGNTDEACVYLTEHADTLADGHIYGGTAAVSEAAEATLEACAQAVTSNQSFAVTPAEEATNEVSTTALDNTGRRAYEVSGLTAGETYEVALVEAATVSTDADGTTTFSAYTLASDATIELVNGSSTGAAAGSGAEDPQVTATAQADGTITFAVDSAAGDNVIPVTFDDADSDGALDLDGTTGEPTEDFGIGGQKNWVPAEAASGTSTETVDGDINTNQDYFVSDGETFYYDSNDLFGFNSATITMAQFEGMLSVNDVIDVIYEQDEAEQSTFDVTTDDVDAPSNVQAVGGDTDGDGENDDVTVTWTASDQDDAVYNVYRGTGGTCADTDTQVADEISGTSVTDEGLADDTYTYCVEAIGGTSGATSGTVDSNDVVIPADDTTAADVFAEGAVVDVNDGFAVADSGDVWVLYFTEDANVASDAALSVNDGGTSVVVENGVNSTWSATDNVVTITLATTLNDGAGSMAYALTIDGIAGVTDDAGNETLIGDVNDTSLEDDGPEVYTDTADATETTFTVTFNEALDPTDAEDETNYTVTLGDGVTDSDVTSATLGADGRTVTLTVATAVDAGSTLDTTVEDTEGQASTQTGYVLV